MTSGQTFKCILAVCCAFAVAAPEPVAADFTFKRLKVKKNHKGPRINIQIEHDPYAPIDKKPEPAPAKPSGKKTKDKPRDLQEWFWKDVSLREGAADFKRMDRALAQLSRNEARRNNLSPSRKQMERLVKAYGKDMLIASVDKNVSPAFLLAVISVESGGKIDAVSSAGAQGLMQLIPDTAKRFGVKDVNDSLQNIKGGAAYLDWLLTQFRYDPLLALAGYNAGEGAVRKHKGIPPYPETRKYVPKVVAAWDVARSMCKSTPLLVTDPCVFKSQ